jgi:uncharacterized circularly permuted ATP-grasp superfamily protein/uncharacterized alpha-E superfamily protein
VAEGRERPIEQEPLMQHMLSGYRPAERRFDEVLASPHTPRPHWGRLFGELLRMPTEQIRERLGAAEKEIRASGVTYNVYADPKGTDRPWDLDVLPMLIPPEEWVEIERGIQQRADLFNRILADLYGDQRLLREGLVPTGLVHGHGGFLRPAHGTRPPGGVFLYVYAADLARSPDGRWWVMADRTQAPSGAGYALENRLIVSRAFPELFRDLSVQHLAAFFAALRDSVSRSAPSDGGPPRIVVLTPGPFNETYFEHAFLARYLGFPLVEGTDLTVRDGQVFVKTIDGLKRVHAILRRQDDDYCDPLELRADSALGVPGLAACARQGSVLMANALGSGVLESGALLGYLPRLCERLVGESLRMPSIATWWCGERAALDDALTRMGGLVFKPADPAWRFEPVFGQDLVGEAADRFRARIRAQPERYVAQELVAMSQAPVLDRSHPRRLAARSVGLRVFAAATPNGYVVMPGGLTRVAPEADARVISMQRGGGSKDTWVISPGPVDASFTLLHNRVGPEDLVRGGASISSRVAENLYWFGRYSERCDDAARLLRVSLAQSLLEGDDNAVAPTLALVKRFGIELPEGGTDTALRAAATREDDPAGLGANLRRLSMVAFSLRDRMSLDNWRTINGLVRDPLFGRTGSLAETFTWLDRIVRELMTMAGFALDGMTRDDGWRFLSMGRRIERLAFMCLALLTAVEEGRTSGLTWLLELADSIVTYRTRYVSRPEWLPVLDLLILDATNPRSLAFHIDGILGLLKRLEQTHGQCGSAVFAPAASAVMQLDRARDLVPESPVLVSAIGGLRSAVFALSDELKRVFFSHAAGARSASIAP